MTISDGVTTVGEFAFYGCKNLTDMTLPGSISTISYASFYECTSLTEVIIPDSVSVISDFAFGYCSNLADVRIGSKVADIGYAAFVACDALTELTIPASVAFIGDYAFEACSKLAQMTFEGDAPSIAEYAFKDSTVTIYYPEDNSTWTADVMQNYGGTITWVEYEPVEEATSGTCGDNLTWTLTADGVLTISGSGEMKNYSYNNSPWYSHQGEIKEVVIENGVASIGTYAFYGCGNLTSIAIPDSVAAIGDCALYGTALTSVSIPASVLSIGSETSGTVFDGCDYLTGIHVDEANPNYSSDVSGVLFNKDKTTLFFMPRGYAGVYAVPDTVTLIDFNAFRLCINLTEIVIPQSVTAMDTMTFYRCTGLEKAVVQAGITELPNECFSGCTSLASVTLPQTLTAIGDGAFYECCNLTSVDIPETVTDVGSAAFAFCKSMTDITLPAGLTKIDFTTFQGCGSLKEIIIPESVLSIEQYAFYDCGLEEITIPAAVTSIGYRAISNCQNLTDVTFQGNAPTFDDAAFEAQTATAYYPAGNTTWTADVMQNYGGTITWMEYEPVEEAASGTCGDDLTWVLDSEGNLTVSGVGAMPDYEYKGAPWYKYRDSIVHVVLEEGVTNLGDYAFYGCTYLTSVTLPESLERIGIVALTSTSISELYIPSGVAEIGPEAFEANSGLGFIRVSEDNTAYSSDEHGVLFNKDKTQLLRCPQSFEGAYVIPETVELVGEKAFDHCHQLTEVTISGSVKELSRHAFFYCTALETVHLQEGLEVIGNEVFSLCSALKGSLTIPASVTKLGNSAFDLTELTEIRFLSDMPEISEYAFSGISLTVFYPADNPTWTTEKIEACKGISTWVPYGEKNYTVTYKSAALALEGSIGINYYVVLSQDVVEASDARMEFTLNGDVQVMPLSEAVLKDGQYCFTAYVAAKNMADTVTAQMYVGDQAVGEAKPYSVKAYCDAAIPLYSDYASQTELVALMKAMLNYGAYSQIQLNHNVENLANADLGDADKVLPETPDLESYAHFATGSEEGISIKSVSLLLESETVIRYYFTLSGDKTIDEYTFIVDGVETEPVQSGDQYYVEKTNIAAKDLDEMYVVNVGRLNVSYCGLSYVRAILNHYSDTSLVNLAKAVYAYNQTANAYFGA